MNYKSQKWVWKFVGAVKKLAETQFATLPLLTAKSSTQTFLETFCARNFMHLRATMRLYSVSSIWFKFTTWKIKVLFSQPWSIMSLEFSFETVICNLRNFISFSFRIGNSSLFYLHKIKFAGFTGIKRLIILDSNTWLL